MNLLLVGNGKGSWTMRGEQLGAALGARVRTAPTAEDWRWADLVILVKRAGALFARQAHQAQVPIVWDALDFWRQPADNAKTASDAVQLLRAAVADIRPVLTIGATQAMADVVDGVYLPHHSWANLEPQAARAAVQVVAYEGSPQYLGAWLPHLLEACRRRGWAFLVNPSDLRTVDVLVAVRDGVWDGYVCREWKSGVKLVNAIAAGRPVIGQASAALREIRPPASLVETPADLDAAFDAWIPLAARAAAVDVCRQLAPEYRLHAVAERYRAALRAVEARCAA